MKFRANTNLKMEMFCSLYQKIGEIFRFEMIKINYSSNLPKRSAQRNEIITIMELNKGEENMEKRC